MRKGFEGLLRVGARWVAMRTIEWPCFSLLQSAQSPEAYRLRWQRTMIICETFGEWKNLQTQTGDAQGKVVLSHRRTSFTVRRMDLTQTQSAMVSTSY